MSTATNGAASKHPDTGPSSSSSRQHDFEHFQFLPQPIDKFRPMFQPVLFDTLSPIRRVEDQQQEPDDWHRRFLEAATRVIPLADGDLSWEWQHQLDVRVILGIPSYSEEEVNERLAALYWEVRDFHIAGAGRYLFNQRGVQSDLTFPERLLQIEHVLFTNKGIVMDVIEEVYVRELIKGPNRRDREVIGRRHRARTPSSLR